MSEQYYIMKDNKYLTRKSFNSDYSFTDNFNFAYLFSDINQVEYIAKQFDAEVIKYK